MVEAQHVASTMKLVDTAAEQNMLEALLDHSKPAYPNTAAKLDYLLATPFRYPTRKGGSRFRGANDPGVFYGAESVATAAAELGYWRWRFLLDAPALTHIEPVAHTAFQVALKAQAVDLRKHPFNADASWVHKSDYGPTQAFAQLVREVALGCIVYQSVRNPDAAWCVAVLKPESFAEPKPRPDTQTWWLAVGQQEVIWRRDRQSLTFQTDSWKSS
jgi:hypothetical protein